MSQPTTIYPDLVAEVCAAAAAVDGDRAEGRLRRALQALTQQPRATVEHAEVGAIRAWVAATKKERGLSLQAIAHAIGLKASGPISAAMKGRPLSTERFTAWQAALGPVAETTKPARRPGQRRTPQKKVAAGRRRKAAVA